MDRTEEARRYFTGDIFATETTGIRIEEARDTYARCSLQLSEKHENANHQIMGGALFTLADFTFAVAANSDPAHVTVTLNSQIQYLRPVKGKTLTAETQVIKDGRSTCVLSILITDELGTQVATVTSTGMRL